MRIVLLSPSEAERGAMHQLLVDDGHEVLSIATREDALDLASAASPDAFIADVHVADLDGPALMRSLDERGLRPSVILLCPRASCGFEHRGGICLTKPVELGQLRRHLEPQRMSA